MPVPVIAQAMAGAARAGTAAAATPADRMNLRRSIVTPLGFSGLVGGILSYCGWSDMPLGWHYRAKICLGNHPPTAEI